MNRLLRRFGARPWDTAGDDVPLSPTALLDVDRGAALTDSAAHRPLLSAGAGAVSPSASALSDVDREAALTDTGAQVPRLATGSATPVPTCPDEQRRTNPAVTEDFDAPQKQAPCPRTGPDRRWASIGRGTPDLAAFDRYGRATSAEVVR
ncbi:hypothetical protein SAMN04244553_6302 [Nocardia amikacinitolerans]|uniref:Uncharacterized protein n=1 Tax=Nocardia amikacinitolerans TaxID=756689 RepID=A0A285LWR2_9NOCA|nr:hypothetical protein [Nocardia amikacinitolerans]SNY89295.1 hypothetical protein SAMN04244553_6302 [Nocardia amikacinitolerans]